MFQIRNVFYFHLPSSEEFDFLRKPSIKIAVSVIRVLLKVLNN